MAKKKPTVGYRKKEKSSGDSLCREWLDKIDRAKEVRLQWRTNQRVDLAYEYYEGRIRPSGEGPDEWMNVNLIYSTLMATLPGLYGRDPYYYVRLKKSYTPNPMDIAMMEQQAKARQAMVNYLQVELSMKQKARMSIQDAMFQYGVFKVSHSADLVENPRAGLPMVDDETGIPYLDEAGNEMPEPDELPANEAYKFTRIHPDDFLVDEDAGPLDDDVSWQAQRVKRPLKDVREDKKYNKKAREQVQPTEMREVDRQRELRKKGSSSSLDSSNSAEPEIVCLWELYDIRNKQWMVLAEGCNEFLIAPEPVPAGIEDVPFATLRFTKRDDSWYPLPPVSQWLDSQKEYCEVRSKILAHRKRFSRMYEMDGSAFDDPEQAAGALEVGEDGTVIIKTGGQMGQAVWPIKDAPLDMQVHTELSYLKQDFAELAIGTNQRGGMSGIDSATEAGIIDSRSKQREGDWVSMVIDFLKTIGRKTDQLVQVHITQDQAVKVSGPQGEIWQMIKTSDYDKIDGEYEYAINVGATTPQIPELERAQWMSLLAVLGNNPILAASEQILKETARMFGIENELLIQEMMGLAKGALQAQQAGPGGKSGSPPGVSTPNPITASGGGRGIANFRGGQ